MKKFLALLLFTCISTVTLASTTWDNIKDWEDIRKDITINSIQKKLSEGWNINTKSTGWRKEPLLIYIVNSDYIDIYEKEDILYFLLESNADVNEVDNDGKTALFYLMKYGPKALPICELLVKHGANINAKDRWGNSLLVQATRYANPVFMEFLVKNGAKADRSNLPEDPLLYFNDNDIQTKAKRIDLFLEAGGDINVQDKNGKTTLMHAAAFQPDEIKLLLEKGADATMRDNEGKNALMYLHDFTNPEYIRSLLDAGIKINDTDKNGRNVLFFPNGNVTELPDIMMSFGADMNHRDNKGNTLLMQPFFFDVKRYEPSIQYWLNKGLDINAQNYEGETFLMLLCQSTADDDAIKKVLMLGAKADIKNNKGETAADYAGKSRYSEPYRSERSKRLSDILKGK